MGHDLRYVTGWVVVRGDGSPGRSVRLRVMDGGASATPADAAAVVRETLGAWAQEIACCTSVPVAAASNDEERGREDGAQRDTLVAPDAVATLLSAILTAGRTLDEQVEMADGLGAVLSARPW